MSQVGLPEPRAVWLAYLISELVLAVVITAAHRVTNRHRSLDTAMCPRYDGPRHNRQGDLHG